MLAVLMTLSGVLWAGPSFADGEAISLTPTQGQAGSAVEVHGSGWQDHARRNIDVPIDLGAVELGRGHPDAQGDFDVTITIPASTSAGEVRIDAIIGNGGSASATFEVTQSAPSAPSDLSVKPSADGLKFDLSWKDNATNESGFQIHNGDELRSVGANETTYAWRVPPLTYMCFRVRAYNAAGASDWTPNASPYYVCGKTPASTDPLAFGYPYVKPTSKDCDEGTGKNCDPDKWNFYQWQCTSWVAYRLNQVNKISFNNSYRQKSGGHWGDAKHWRTAADNAGFQTDQSPEQGDVAWYSYGHVGYVERVNSDGTVLLSEMNYSNHNEFRFIQITKKNHWPTAFLHVV